MPDQIAAGLSVMTGISVAMLTPCLPDTTGRWCLKAFVQKTYVLQALIGTQAALAVRYHIVPKDVIAAWMAR